MYPILTKHFRFEASHILPLYVGKCSRLHGHSWALSVSVQGPIQSASGFVVDYGELSEIVRCHIIHPLDHTHLGQGLAYCQGVAQAPYFGTSFYPSSENIAIAIGKILQPLVKELAPDVRLYEIKIGETCTSECAWRPEDEHIHDERRPL